MRPHHRTDCATVNLQSVKTVVTTDCNNRDSGQKNSRWRPMNPRLMLMHKITSVCENRIDWMLQCSPLTASV
jgi:hypothetical protein